MRLDIHHYHHYEKADTKPCPKCSGSGVGQYQFNMQPNGGPPQTAAGWPISGPPAVVIVTEKACPRCSGKGHVEVESGQR